MSAAALFDDGTRGATLSADGRYRWDLWRRWDDGPLLGFVMLNPSVGDASVDDPTLVRCIGFARRDGYAGIVVRNLYCLRSPKPAALAKADDPIGCEADEWLRALAGDRFGVRAVVAAWGAPNVPKRLDVGARIRLVLDLFAGRGLLRFADQRDRMTGGPAAPHPLYLPADTPIREYAR